MKPAINQFKANIDSVRELDKSYALLENNLKTMPAIRIDTSELLRAQIVMVVSALDCFIHDVVRLGMLECFEGKRQNFSSPSYSNFGISLSTLEAMLKLPDKVDRMALLNGEIRRVNGFKTFQEPDDISKALNLIGVPGIWEKVANDLATDPKTVKNKIQEICKWRHRIAHEADIDGTYGFAGIKHNIDQASVQAAVDMVESICYSIFKFVQ